jgi:hypothetical protein
MFLSDSPWPHPRISFERPQHKLTLCPQPEVVVRAIAPLVATLVLAGCHSRASDESDVHLRRPCPEPATDTISWVAVSSQRFATVLPREFVLDAVTFRCHHGGEVWASGARWFGYCNGNMEPSFPTGERLEQVLDVAGRSAIVRCYFYEGQWSVSAYHIEENAQFGIHGMSPDRATLAVFLRALGEARAP